MPRKFKKYLVISLLAIIVLTGSVGLGLVPVNLFFAKATISEAFKDSLGAEFEIHGSLWIRFGPRPIVSASDITLSQPGISDKPLLKIDDLTIRPRLREVLAGDIHLNGLSASGVIFDYCQILVPSQSHGSTGGDDRPSIAVDELRITNIQPKCTEARHQLEMLPKRLDLVASLPREGPARLEIESRGDDEAMLLSVSGANLASLLENPPAYPVELKLSALDSEIRIKGTVGNPLNEPVLDASIAVDSPNPSVLLNTLGVEIPGLDALTANMDIRADSDKVQIDRLEASLGRNKIALTGFVQDFSSKPYFEIEAQLAYLDIEQLMVGQSQNHEESGLEDIRLQPWFDVLAKFDGKARLKIDKLLNTPYQVDKLILNTGLDDGVLSIVHSEVLLAGTPVTAVAELNTRLACARLTGEVKLTDFDLSNLDAVLVTESVVSGQIERASVQGSSCGNTLMEHLESFQGRVTLADAYLHPGNEDLALRVSHADAEFAWNQPGQLSIDTGVLGETLSAAIGFGPLVEILDGESWPLSINAMGAEVKLDLSGTAAIPESGLQLDAELNLDIPQAGWLLAWVDGDPDNQLVFSGSTSMHLNDSEVILSHVNARLGSSDLSGDISWSRFEKGSPIIVDLQSDNLHIEELASLFPGSKELTPTRGTSSQADFPDFDLIDSWFDFPAVNLDLQAANVDGLDSDIAQVSMHARLRNRLIEEGQLSMQFEGYAVDGAIDMDFREKPWSINSQLGADMVDVGTLMATLDWASDVNAQAERLDLSYQSEGHSLEQMVENVQIEASLESLCWIVEAEEGNSAYTFELSELNLSATPSSSVEWRSQGVLNGVPIKVWLKSPPLSATFDGHTDLPLSLVIGIGNDVMMLQSVIDRKVQDGFKADVSISGQHMDIQSVSLSELESPLGEYEINSNVATREGEAIFSELNTRVGNSYASGGLEVHRKDNGQHFVLQLSSPFIETVDLMNWMEVWRNLRQTISGEGTSNPVVQINDVGVLTLINQKLDEFTEGASFDIKLDIEDMRSAGTPLGKTQIGLMADEKEFHLQPLQITLADGSVEAELHSNYVEGGIESELNINIDAFEYDGLMRLFDPESQAGGHFYMNADLSSMSPDASSVLNNLQGEMDLLIFPDDIAAGFLDLWASNLILALLDNGDDSSKKLNCMVAHFDVEDGVMKSHKTFLDSTEIIVHIRGTIDLIAKQLDLIVAPQAKMEKFLSVSTPIEVNGPFDDFNTSVTAGGLAMTMVRWYYGLIYVPWKWLTGERFPADGIETCFKAFDLETVEPAR